MIAERRKRRTWFAASLSLALASAAALGEPSELIHDDFSDGQLYASNEKELRWTGTSAASGMEIVEEEGGGHVLGFGVEKSSAAVAGLLPEGEAVRLGEEPNDSLTLSFRFRLRAKEQGKEAVRFGLYDDRGTHLEDDEEEGEVLRDDRGYRVDFTQNGSSHRTILETGEHGSLAGGADSRKLESATRGGIPALGVDWHDAELSIMRIPEGIGLIARLDGKEVSRTIDREASIQEFHLVAIATTTPNTNGMEISNVRLSVESEDGEAELVESTSDSDGDGLTAGKVMAVLLGALFLGGCGVFWAVALFGPKE